MAGGKQCLHPTPSPEVEHRIARSANSQLRERPRSRRDRTHDVRADRAAGPISDKEQAFVRKNLEVRTELSSPPSYQASAVELNNQKGVQKLTQLALRYL
ncbi:MAG: hypothetical protein NVS4B2_23220 [Chloroflexota bacterium]